jgi:urease accessory protein UreH
MAGRITRNEAWQFSEFTSETRLSVAGKVIYLDRFRLSADPAHAAGPWTLGRHGYCGTGIAFGDRAGMLAKHLHDELSWTGVDTPAGNLALLRAAVSHGPELHRCREVFAALAAADDLTASGRKIC